MHQQYPLIGYHRPRTTYVLIFHGRPAARRCVPRARAGKRTSGRQTGPAGIAPPVGPVAGSGPARKGMIVITRRVMQGATEARAHHLLGTLTTLPSKRPHEGM
jgi:hypothetical protein